MAGEGDKQGTTIAGTGMLTWKEIISIIAPESIPVTLLTELAVICMVVGLAQLLLYTYDMCTAGDYNEQWFDGLEGFGWTLLSLGVGTYSPGTENEKIIQWCLDSIISFIQEMLDSL